MTGNVVGQSRAEEIARQIFGDLATAVRVVARGDSLISPSMTLVADGLTNDEIARKLYMSPATVRTHVSRAMTKLGVRDRAQLVVLAYETGLVRPNWLT